MSAFMTTKTHIGALSAFYADDQDYGDPESTYRETFDLLNQANAESMKARYGEDLSVILHTEAPGYFNMSRIAQRLGPVAILKAVRCFEYQACEHAGWEQSKAYKRLQNLIAGAVRKLPGYEQAQWAIDDPSEEESDQYENVTRLDAL